MSGRTTIGRREFLGAAAMAAGGFLTGCSTMPTAAKSNDGFIWSALFHMGTNMWCDHEPETGWPPYVDEYKSIIGAANHVRFDERLVCK